MSMLSSASVPNGGASLVAQGNAIIGALDSGQDLDVGLLDSVVNTFYSGRNAEVGPPELKDTRGRTTDCYALLRASWSKPRSWTMEADNVSVVPP